MDSKRISQQSLVSASRRPASRSTATILGLLSVLTLSIASGCGDDFSGTEVVCHKGDTRECLGPGACKGAQECTATGSGFQPCQCGDNASEGGGGGTPPAEANSGTGNGGTSSTMRGGAPSAGGSHDSSLGGDTSMGGGDGEGGTGGPQYECSPIGNVGCSATQNCSLDTGEPSCVTAGTKPQLSACDMTSDCAPGLFCQVHNCVKVCGATGDCAGSGASSKCGIGMPRPELGLPILGSCVRPCDVLAQDCPAGQACYLGSCLVPVVAGVVDTECDSATKCAKGLDCLVDLDRDTAPDCSKYCSLSAQKPCADGFACYPLSDVFTGLPADWGICTVQ